MLAAYKFAGSAVLSDQLALKSSPALTAELANVNRVLQEGTADDAPYAAMARAFLAP